MEQEEKNVETVEVEAEQVEEVKAEVVEEPKKEKVIDGSFFSKLGDKIKAKVDKTKHNMAVSSEISKIFSENASRYTLLDSGLKGAFKPLLEKDEDAKTFTFLGKANFKDNTLLKDREGNIFKILTKVEGEHTRTFTAQGEEHVRDLEVYSYKEV